jgi:hypothetical protein
MRVVAGGRVAVPNEDHVEQLHGALEVGEQHRDLLALAFERGL